MIPPGELELVKKTLPIFNQKSVEVAEELYRNIFRLDPTLRGLFSVEFLTPKPGAKPSSTCPFAAAKEGKLDESISVQARILAATIVDFAANIDSIVNFESKIDRICNLHVSRDIQAAHYTVVAGAFDEAAKTVLGDLITDDEHKAWMAAIMALAGIFIEREKTIREAAEARQGAWSGFREFRVGEEGQGSGKVTLYPSDGKDICHVGRGQFSCVRMKIEGLGIIHSNSVVQTAGHKPEAPSAAASPLTRRTSSRTYTPKPVNQSVGSSRLSMEDGKYVLLNPSKALSQKTKSGEVEIVELSVPVGGQSVMDKNEAGVNGQKAKWENGLLRNVLGGQNFQPKPKMGNPLLRNTVSANGPGKMSPMGQKGPLSPMARKGPLAQVTQNHVNGSPAKKTGGLSREVPSGSPIAMKTASTPHLAMRDLSISGEKKK